MDITPSPRILRALGEIEFAEWQCIAELIDNAFDDFTEIMKSGKAWPGGFKVSVSLPNARGRLEDSEVLIQDTGQGMSRRSLENSVRAGWSSNDRWDKLGLFGMGFNVSTARLGNRTQVFTTQAGDPEWTGVEIDLGEIRHDFQAKDLSEAKTDLSEHGTRIIISQLKQRHAQWLQRNAAQLREVLGRIYSWILESSPVELWVGGVRVQPRKACIWGEDRYVLYGSGKNAEQIPAVIKIDQKYSAADACGQCGNWQETGTSVCQECGSEDLQTRERRIHGWLGIQRHLDKRDFGIDFLRNGRKILKFDKRIFDWTDPNDPVAGTETEYPVDLAHLGGRIVGEIHLDHVPVTYSKDAFEYSDRSWRGALDYLRGTGPLLPRSAERLGYPRNTSPLARLVEGYRRVDAGRRNLIPGDGNGPIHAQTRDWARRFWAGDPEYQTDAKWWDAVESHESRKNAEKVRAATESSPNQADEFAVLAALGAVDVAPNIAPPESTPKSSKDGQVTVQDRLDRLANSVAIPELSRTFGIPDLGILEVEAYVSALTPLTDDLGNPTPVWLKLGAGRSAKAYIDPKHQLFSQFGCTFADALLMEIAPLMKVRAQSSFSHSQIASELRITCLKDTAIDFATIKGQAHDLVLEIRTLAARQVEEEPQRAVQHLTPDERTTIENGIVSEGGQYTADVWKDGTFLMYAPPLYLVKLLESWPEAFMDGKVFRGPYSSLASPATQRLSVAKVVGYLNDLATVLTAQTTPSTAQLQRTRWSCDLLAGELCE
ncbi:ATP-binding protein [Paenarthrobacter sp. YIM B13468]|uniref:ATP-binding protein n=1 Tax=Paenarthrobacter sp. YIM B13468 TaxID=3366295 RepID=UPI00366D2262